MASVVLQEFADEFDWCALCWSRERLHIHHIVQGSGRKHIRINLVRLCEACHRALHDGGRLHVTKGMVLSAKREADPEHYSPRELAALRGRVGLAYDPERVTDEIKRMRKVPPEAYLMSCNSRAKGARGEREAAEVVNTFIPHALARRGQQHSGTETSADLVSPGTPDLWWEVKRVQKLNLHAVMEKARSQCGTLIPVVLHRKNNDEWLVTLPLKDVQAFAMNVHAR